MKGDANEAKDPEPYTADTVRRVMFSIPGVAPTIQQFRDPFVLGGITIAASLLVVWAFWPRREEDADGDEVAHRSMPSRFPLPHSCWQRAVVRSQHSSQRPR